MKEIIIFLVISFVMTSLVDTESLRRIHNGQSADTSMFPYMVGITHSLKNYHCGGAILTDRWIISARHCFKKKLSKQYYITIGTIEQNLQNIPAHSFIPIREILFYEGAETSIKVHDISLGKTQHRIPIDGKRITPVDLPFLEQYYGGTIGQFSGFGQQMNGQDLINTEGLQFMDARVLHNGESRCKGKDQMMCMTAINDGTTTCPGDAGSPLVLRGTRIIIGILHGGSTKCGDVNNTSLLSRITYYSDWIEEQTGLKFTKKQQQQRKSNYNLNFSG